MNSPPNRKRVLSLAPLIVYVFCIQLPQQTHQRVYSPTHPQRVANVTGHLKILGFTLGRSTLTDVEAKLGKSDVRRCSSEEEASKEICYLARNGQTRVVFQSGASGGWKMLDSYKVISGNLQRSCYRQCPTATQLTNNVQTEGGLRLGLTRNKLIALLGPPREIRGNEFIFEWESRQRMTKEQQEAESKTFNSPITDSYYDVQDKIEVTLAGSKVVEFAVSHVVSY